MVLSLSFVLLLLAFRSIVIPAKAILMNLLSVGASYGLLVLVFQKGVGAELLGLTQVESIEAWVPLMLFALLFGLSMDYQVFLLSRIKERFDHTGDTREAVGYGVGRTAGIITGAAAIMVCVFGGMATGELVMFQQMGFGLAVAIFIDATIVRTIIVPAAMELLGDWNWYLPRWLEWLPNVSIEGRAPDAGAGEGPRGQRRREAGVAHAGHRHPRRGARADRLNHNGICRLSPLGRRSEEPPPSSKKRRRAANAARRLRICGLRSRSARSRPSPGDSLAGESRRGHGYAPP